MRRRAFLAALAAGIGSLAGCTAGDGTPTSTRAPTETSTETPTDLPDGVYVQPFAERMAMQGTATAGDYAVAVLYTTPHVFWTVTGSDRQRVPRSGDVHLMATVWDPKTGAVLPEAGVSVEITRDGDLVSEEVIYPMLSQRMGFHYGANFGLDGDGEYAVSVSVGGTGVRRTGSFRGRFGDPATLETPLRFTDDERGKVSTRPLDAHGSPGAVEPMEMSGVPNAAAPARESLPGRVVGSGRSDDAVLLAGVLDAPPEGVEGEGAYLYVSARTPYNRLVLPSMALSATLTRGGETAFDGELVRTLDPDLHYHYGAAVPSVESGDALELRVPTPPQVARHEGYERAFLRMAPVRLTVP